MQISREGAIVVLVKGLRSRLVSSHAPGTKSSISDVSQDDQGTFSARNTARLGDVTLRMRTITRARL